LDIGWVTREEGVGTWEEIDREALRDYDKKVRVEGSRPVRPLGCRKPTVEERKRARSGQEQPSYVMSVTPLPPVLPPLAKGKKRVLDHEHDPEVGTLLDTSPDARLHSPKQSRTSSQKPPDAPQHFLQAIPSITALSATSNLTKKTSNITIATCVSKRAASRDAPAPTRLKRTRTELAVDMKPEVRTVRRSTTKAATTATATTTTSSAKHSKAKTVQGKPLTTAVDVQNLKPQAATTDDKNPKTKTKTKTKAPMESKRQRPYFNPLPKAPEHMCPVAQAFVWGAGNFDQFGMGADRLALYDKPTRNKGVEERVGGEGMGIESVAAGGSHTVFIDKKGTVCFSRGYKVMRVSLCLLRSGPVARLHLATSPRASWTHPSRANSSTSTCSLLTHTRSRLLSMKGLGRSESSQVRTCAPPSVMRVN
jgi:hypothetical protein